MIDSSHDQHTSTITYTAAPRVWHFSAFHFVVSACARVSAIRPDASRDFRAQKTVSLYFGVEGFCDSCHWNFGPGKIGPGTKISAGKNGLPDHIFW